MKFGYQRAADGVFEGKGLRSFFEYRDLGIGAATGGKYHAQVIRATDVCRDGTGRHTHTLDFQMVYVLKGTVTFWYEGEGEITMGAGDCVHQPPGIKHELMSCSSDCELLEITSPEVFETHDV
jgi:mannose-6-phosphate isomerase-like protein (cupin superfamily)